MNFRQRVAWLLLLSYLACSCAALYYLFELQNWYNMYAVEHIETHHSDSSLTWRLVDMPAKMWMVVLVTVYLQVFFLLLVCTKAMPQCSLALFWPLYLYLQCRSCFLTLTGPSPKLFSIPVGHGHVVIDT